MHSEFRLDPRAIITGMAALALAVVFLCHQSSAPMALEMRTYDWRARTFAGSAAEQSIVIVGVDADSLQSLQPLWGPNALTRDRYVTMVTRLSAAGASAIGLDVSMVRPSEHDRRLAEAIRAAGNVVLVTDAVAKVEPDQRMETYTFTDPPRALRAAARYIASPLMQRPDNVVRFFRPWQASADGTRKFPALATALALLHNPEPPDQDSVSRTGRDHSAGDLEWIRWTGGATAFDVIPARDVVAGRIDAGKVRGKIALIGRWDEMEDTLQTPAGPLPGVAVHGHATATLLGGPWLHRWPILDISVALLLVLSLAVVACRTSTVKTTGWLLLLLALLWLIGFAAFREWGVWIELVPSSAALLVAWAFVSLMQGERVLGWVERQFPSWVSSEPMELVGTVLVCDIRGYTTRSEKEAAAETMRFLEDFFVAVDHAVAPHGGITARRPGDAAIVLFRETGTSTAERGGGSHADRAVRAAIDLRATLVGLAAEFRAKGREPFEAGTTLVTGSVSVGVLGSEHKEPQIIGDPVNTAFRLQEYARENRQDLLVSGRTVDALTAQFHLTEVGDVRVRGREEPISLWTISAETQTHL